MMDNNHIPTATSSLVSSSNLSSLAIDSPEVSQHISFKGASLSTDDTSQRSTRMVQYVPKRPTNDVTSKMPSYSPASPPTPVASATDQLLIFSADEKQNMSTAEVMPLNCSQWISHILDQEGDADQRSSAALHGCRRRLASVRSMWEGRISEETEQKQHEEQINAALYARRQFLFPKWRSVDPLTASLVASHKTPEMIPMDSRIPQHRHNTLIETERMAPYAKLELHKPYIEQAVTKQLQRDAKRIFVPARPKNAEQMAWARANEILYRQKAPWYNLDEIRQQISHESIANVGTTRQMFEHHHQQQHTGAGDDRMPEEQRTQKLLLPKRTQ